MMDPQVLRSTAWQEMITAEARASFFADQVNPLERLDRWITTFVLAASSGAVLTALQDLPAWLRPWPALIAAGLSLYQLTRNYAACAREASELHVAWSAVARDYERLFNHWEEQGAEERYYAIYSRADGLSKAGLKFRVNQARFDELHRAAHEMAEARYA